jgi:hypothetical protein
MLTILRFCDLKAAGICRNWTQLNRMIALHGFPPGKKISPQVRVWNEADVMDWWNASAANSSRTQITADRPLKKMQQQQIAAE